VTDDVDAGACVRAAWAVDPEVFDTIVTNAVATRRTPIDVDSRGIDSLPSLDADYRPRKIRRQSPFSRSEASVKLFGP
jgi:hypothetical protein